MNPQTEIDTETIDIILHVLKGEPIQGDITAFLKSCRKAKSLSQRDLADQASVSLDWYRAIEQGRAPNASIQTLVQLGHALRLNGEDIRTLVKLAKQAGQPKPESQSDAAKQPGPGQPMNVVQFPDRNLPRFFRQHHVDPVTAAAIVSLAEASDKV